jgi:hypothetical protein
MVDWNGLLNWSVKIQEEEKAKGNNPTPYEFKPMSEEDAKWLEQALESVCVNEMKEIFKILDRLKEPEGDEQDMENRLNDLEDLLVLVDGLENGRNIVRAKRFNELVQYFYSTKYKKIKLMLGNVLTSMLQNDKYVQEAAIEVGLFKQVLISLNETDDPELVDKYLYLLTGLLYGDNEKARMLFLSDYDGLKLLGGLLFKTDGNHKNFKRVLCIIKELSRKEDKGTDGYKTRFLLIEKMKEYNIHLLLLKIMGDACYTKPEDGEFREVVFDIFLNTVGVFDSLDLMDKIIDKMSNKISMMKDVEKEKEEKMKLEQFKETLKTEFENKDNEGSVDPNVEMLENGNIAIKLKD